MSPGRQAPCPLQPTGHNAATCAASIASASAPTRKGVHFAIIVIFKPTDLFLQVCGARKESEIAKAKKLPEDRRKKDLAVIHSQILES